MKSTPEPRLFHLVHRLHQALFRAGDRMLVEELGITTSQSAVLMFLDGRTQASMSDLASAVGLKITSVSGLVDRMEKKGLVARRRSETDRRSFHIELTDSGRALTAKAKPLVRENNARLLATIGERADAEKFADVCETLIEAVEQHHTDQPHSQQIAKLP